MGLFNSDPSLSRNIILDHYENPHNLKSIENISDDYVKYHNKSSTCIDDITIYLKLQNEIIIDAVFAGIGCAISTASTDILCDLIKDKTLNQAQEIINEYLKMIKEQEYNEEILSELAVFYNIPKQPNRIKCSMMGIVAAENLIENKLKND